MAKKKKLMSFDDFEEDFEREGILSALSKSPAAAFLDPLQLGADPDPIRSTISEDLDPETMQRLARARQIAVGLREAPLQAEMASRRARESGLAQQFAAQQTQGAARQGAIANQGASLGSQIVGKFGGQMARESVGRFGLANRLANAQRALEQGQVLEALQERIKNEYAQRGLQLNSDQAKFMAASAIASQVASMQNKGQTPTTSQGAAPMASSPSRGAFPVRNPEVSSGFDFDSY